MNANVVYFIGNNIYHHPIIADGPILGIEFIMENGAVLQVDIPKSDLNCLAIRVTDNATRIAVEPETANSVMIRPLR